MASTRALSGDKTPSASSGLVNEVSAGGRVERVLPTTTDHCPVSGRVVWASLSGDLIHQSRRAGWGLRSGVTKRSSH